MSGKLGFSKSKSAGQSSPFFMSSGHSGWSGSRFDLDPSIRKMQDDALGQYAGTFGEFGQATDRYLNQSSSLRNSYLGNQGALVNARVNPIKEKFAALSGKVSQDLGRRGVGGSSFGYGTMRDINTQGAREEGDARALATQESLGFEASLNESELNALNQAAMNRAKITGETLEVAKARLAQEMSIFGLGSQSSQVGSNIGAEFGVKGK